MDSWGDVVREVERDHVLVGIGGDDSGIRRGGEGEEGESGGEGGELVHDWWGLRWFVVR